jgi:hypothetical protein
LRTVRVSLVLIGGGWGRLPETHHA